MADIVTTGPAAPFRSRDAGEVTGRVLALYAEQTGFLRARFAAYSAGEDVGRVRAFYPLVRLVIEAAPRGPVTRAYGYASYPGTYETTVTRPDLYRTYLTEQFAELIENHGAALEVALSETPVPLPFAAPESLAPADAMDMGALSRAREHFDLPDLTGIDDAIANGDIDMTAPGPRPMALFTAPRVDYSLHRLKHYCGTDPKHFQNFVLFTNYQDYIDDFAGIAEEAMARGGEGFSAFVSPGLIQRPGGEPEGIPPRRQPQMPAYHLVRPDGGGITMVNIGVGPSNAKTITDHIAVLRPWAWLMLGHCAGLRKTQKLGDYVLGHAYLRDDHVLDDDVAPWTPIPALAEVQVALERAVASVTGLKGTELKAIMRTGTVASVDNRNWELRDQREPNRKLSQSRAIALDMESAAIAANGFRFRVPYGTLLCVSDKPLHGELKLPGVASAFYRSQVRRHLDIGMKAMENLRALDPEELHSRKLRSFDEPLLR